MKRRLVGGAIGVLTLVGAVVFGATSPANAVTTSLKVAMIESPTGIHGGTIPTTGYPATNLPTAPTFTNVTLAQVGSTDDFLSTNSYDTAILNQVCDIAGRLAAPDGLFKNDLANFVTGGGKLLIWDSGCPNTDYSNFAVPFHTINPGTPGINGGAMTITEQTGLGTNVNPVQLQSVNVSAIAGTTNGALNANQFFTTDPNWCVAMSVANPQGANGGVVNYAKLGTGLIVWSGLSMTNMTSPDFTPANSALGSIGLNRVLMNQLALPNTSSLHCIDKAQAVLTLTPKSQTQVVGQTANLSAHLVSDGIPVENGTVTLTVTSGPDTNLPAAHVNTNASGDAAFTYVSGIPATNTLTATAMAPAANISLSDPATVTWTARVTTTTTPAVTATPTFTG